MGHFPGHWKPVAIGVVSAVSIKSGIIKDNTLFHTVQNKPMLQQLFSLGITKICRHQRNQSKAHKKSEPQVSRVKNFYNLQPAPTMKRKLSYI